MKLRLTVRMCENKSLLPIDIMLQEPLPWAVKTPIALEPLKLNIFNGQHSVVTHMMQGVTMRIGIAEYQTDLLIVRDTQFDHLFGANFFAGYAVKTHFRRGTV